MRCALIVSGNPLCLPGWKTPYPVFGLTAPVQGQQESGPAEVSTLERKRSSVGMRSMGPRTVRRPSPGSR